MFLLDDRAFLWVLDPSTTDFSSVAKNIIKTSDELFISMASLWKITAKISEGKLTVPFEPSEFTRICAARSINVISVSSSELDVLKKLPLLHTEPFDRMIVATAITHDFTIVTNNADIARYDVATVS